ncbi:ROK family protein [Nocardia sp. CDC159]|uniref:ROK family protein n=1 Tax=Nocardia pulmonis TaxID=2951408 RepID=A0A9X2E8E1_9NOCA|nr:MULTISPECIES: ROK family protein [Nocardia]MCM6774780.1 ROK family protein [Nocardia pulmonis]MCM6789711.1 ROK family protein [Nocardia sp. CDC159]
MTTVGPEDLVLAVDVGGTTIKAEITDAAGTVHSAGTVATPHGEAAFDAMADLGAKLLAELPAPHRDRVARAAVVLPGIVDPIRGLAVFSSNIGWRDVKVGNRFRDRWQMPVLLEHDVAVAGWAEWRYGAGRGHDDVCVVILGTGISGTLSVNGRLVRGAVGQAGEYGHIPVRHRDGLRCPCGSIGCVETVASGAAIARAYTARTGREIPGAETVFAVLDTDPDARFVVDDAVDALAEGLFGVIHASCPSLIVLGGGLAGAGAVLTGALQSRFDTLLRVATAPRVVLGEFGARAGLVGAAHYARVGALE